MEIWWESRQAPGGVRVQQCGSQVCGAGHQYGPAVRDHYLVHFVASGRGQFWTEAARYTLGPGEGFLIFPGQLTTYRADAQDPWTYSWVGYAGVDAASLTAQVGLTRDAPVFRAQDPHALLALMGPLPGAAAGLRLGALASLGGLYQILARIGQSLTQATPDVHQEYYRKALWYMEGNHDRPISVEDVAAFVGLSRSQLFRVFQKVAGVSPKGSLTAIRMRHARQLVQGTTLTASAIAASVGVSSAARLGVLFRQTYGMTLSDCRRVPMMP